MICQKNYLKNKNKNKNVSSFLTKNECCNTRSLATGGARCQLSIVNLVYGCLFICFVLFCFLFFLFFNIWNGKSNLPTEKKNMDCLHG